VPGRRATTRGDPRGGRDGLSSTTFEMTISADNGGAFRSRAGRPKVTGSMGVYLAIFGACALLSVLCASFILAQSPRERATQLAALLVGGGATFRSRLPPEEIAAP